MSSCPFVISQIDVIFQNISNPPLVFKTKDFFKEDKKSLVALFKTLIHFADSSCDCIMHYHTQCADAVKEYFHDLASKFKINYYIFRVIYVYLKFSRSKLKCDLSVLNAFVKYSNIISFQVIFCQSIVI